jgi:hypothetical protein
MLCCFVRVGNSVRMPKRVVLLLLLMMTGGIPLRGADVPAGSVGAGGVDFAEGSADGIGGEIAEKQRLFRGTGRHLIPGDWSAMAGKTLGERLRMKFALTYDALGLGTLGDRASGAASGDVALSLRWQLLAEQRRAPLALSWRLRHRHAYSEEAPSAVEGGRGLLWRLVDGFNDRGLEVPELYLEQQYFRKRMLLRWGQMAPDDLLDDHPLRSAKKQFLNQAFSSSPAVGFPGSGLGLMGRWHFREEADVTVSASNVQTGNLDDGARWRLESDALFQGVQGGWNFGDGQRLQLLVWRTDGLAEESLEADRGVSLTWSRVTDGDARWFGRVAVADGGTVAATKFGAAGVSFRGRESDRWGVGISAGEDGHRGRGWQVAGESFYRWQLTPDLQVTGFAQAAAGDDVSAGRGWLLAAGVRTGLRF